MTTRSNAQSAQRPVALGSISQQEWFPFNGCAPNLLSLSLYLYLCVSLSLSTCAKGFCKASLTFAYFWKLVLMLVPIVPAKLTSGPRMRVLDTNWPFSWPNGLRYRVGCKLTLFLCRKWSSLLMRCSPPLREDQFPLMATKSYPPPSQIFSSNKDQD